MVQVYDKVGRDIEQHFVQFVNSPLMNSMRTLLEYILLVRNSVRDINAALALLQRAVEGMLEGMMLTHGDPETMARYRDSHLVVLKTLQDPRMYGPQWTNKQVTRYKSGFNFVAVDNKSVPNYGAMALLIDNVTRF